MQITVLISCVSEKVTRGERVKVSKNFVDVVNGSPSCSQLLFSVIKRKEDKRTLFTRCTCASLANNGCKRNYEDDVEDASRAVWRWTAVAPTTASYNFDLRLRFNPRVNLNPDPGRRFHDAMTQDDMNERADEGASERTGEAE